MTKNSANALAPGAVCLVASIGITGGFSALEVTFGPVRGTSAGTVGCADFGRAVLDGATDVDADVDVGVVLTVTDALVGSPDVEVLAEADVVGTAVLVDALDAIVAAG